MAFYRVCYFNSLTNQWEIALNKDIAFIRQDYLSKTILSLSWLEKVTLPCICENCEHCYWLEEHIENYCDIHRTLIPGDWSCPDFSFIKKYHFEHCSK